MEWLEFGRWSPEVEQQLAHQAERLSITARLPPHPQRPENASSQAIRLAVLLRRTSASNPWGHPVAEC
jgi:hypothetical protein